VIPDTVAAPLAFPDTAARLGRALGPPFQVVRLLGRGGFAEVYEVEDTELRRRLAVKVLRPDLPWGPRTTARFLQEARTLARLNHPNTLPIYFAGEGEGLVYYAMPFLDGCSLAELLRRDGPLGVPRALAIVGPVLEALSHAHEHGIVHRDVKPDNIVVEAASGRPLLVDFGIARSLDGAGHHTEAGFVVGTPLYMSPEQALGRPDVGPRADLYAIGAVLFEMLTGRPPFTGCDSQEIVGLHLTQPVPVAAISREDVPPWLRGVIVRCLAKRPEDRYPSAAALLEALRNEEMPTDVPPPVSAHSFPSGSVGAGGTDTIGGGAIAPTVQLPQATRPRFGPRRRALALLGVLAITLTALVAFFFPEAALVAENRLTEPVTLAVGDEALLLEPGDRARIPVPWGRRLEAHWALVRPTARDGRALGDVIEGTFTAPRASGELRTTITAEQAGARWATPLVVNRTPHAFRISVISARDSTDCGCYVPAGDSLAVGYYILSAQAAVRVTDVLGRTARYAGLDALVQPETGVVRVEVDTVHLRRPDPKELR
jgi:hypothetical protein